ncbi:GNAT family N-acetyltransferase [Vibrio coralliilyticus]|uniref:GNAT family N-acetyltransferase n=1 Tax=Vibrio coralliilyticus TaxID=190893 RepID=UPI000BAA9C4B|nr:GNAT family N-acetyltransferase [Vibrio coralliilyticus]NOI58439.1 GNAT family N-acetyltransferase [Vibrio coralliilyticus]PAT67567.1 GNAT family N-acetyltransferase [Vibrio coralliilyticus]
MQIETFDPIKLPLVSRLYKAHYPSGKVKKDELIIVGTIDQQIVSLVRFRNIEQLRLLTGMLVIPEHRGSGLGHQLMGYCAQYVLSEHDFCFAYAHLETFYAQHNFKTIDASQLPNSLKGLFERYSLKKQLVAMKYVKPSW